MNPIYRIDYIQLALGPTIVIWRSNNKRPRSYLFPSTQRVNRLVRTLKHMWAHEQVEFTPWWNVPGWSAVLEVPG